MARIVKGGLIQAANVKDPSEASVKAIKDAMIEKHVKMIEEAAAKGVQVLCLQELFYGPYFCAEQDVKWYDLTEKVPDGESTRLMQELARKHGMAIVVPVYEEDIPGVYYNTAAVIDADGKYLGKYRKHHIPHCHPGFWEKFYFKPGNLGYPVFDTQFCKVGVYICYDRHFPEGARALGLNGAELVFIPSATSRGLSEYLWRVEQVSHALANGYFVGTINRVGIEPLGDDDFYGQSYFVDPRGQFVGDVGDAHEEALIVRDLDLDKIAEVRNTWQFYRDRRPDAYDDLTRP
jgi:N-carbamoylputrescine amidase